MNNVLSLTKVFLKNSFYLFDNSKKGRMNPRTKGILFFVFIGLCFMPTLAGTGYLTSVLCDSVAEVGMLNILPGLFLTIASIATALFALFYVVNVFYFGNDYESILHMPLKPYEILSARLITVLVYEYATELLFVLVPMSVYGVKYGGPMYWLYAAIVFLTLPIVPVIICSIIAMLVMPVLNIAKNKDMVKMMAGVLMIVILVGYSVVSNRFFTSGIISENGQAQFSQKQMVELLQKGDTSVLGTISRVIPSVRFSALAIVNENNVDGFFNILIYLAFNVLAFLIFIALGQLLYMKGISGLNQGYSRKKYDISKISGQTSAGGNVVLSYAMKELRILFRTPIYFINCVLVTVLLPVIILVSLPLSANPKPGSVKGEAFLFFSGVIDWTSYAAIVFVSGFAIGIVASSLNSVASTAISRDGHDFVFFKYIPLKIETQIWGKLIPAFALCGFGSFFMIIAAYIVHPVPAWVVLLVLPSVIMGILFESFIGLTIDVIMPKLNWVNETAAVKQNMNVLIVMAISIAFAAASVFLAVKFFSDVNNGITIAVFAILFIALDIASYILLINTARKRIPDIMI